MSEELKQRIKEFNEIKYPNDNETRIIIRTVTTAINNKQ